MSAASTSPIPSISAQGSGPRKAERRIPNQPTDLAGSRAPSQGPSGTDSPTGPQPFARKATTTAISPSPGRLGKAVDAVLPDRWLARRQFARIEKAVAPADNRVQAGPFTGMQLVNHAPASRRNKGKGPAPYAIRSRIPKLLGSYERELHAALGYALARRPRLVVHIGSAEGYYAVGIARALPDVRVLAYDLSPEARVLAEANIAANDVEERVALRDRCPPESLGRMLGIPTLVFVDTDGARRDVLCSDALEQMATTDLIVELTEKSGPFTTDLMHRHLAATHEFTLIKAAEPDPRDYPLLHRLPPDDQRLAITETRDSPHIWLVALHTGTRHR